MTFTKTDIVPTQGVIAITRRKSLTASKQRDHRLEARLVNPALQEAFVVSLEFGGQQNAVNHLCNSAIKSSIVLNEGAFGSAARRLASAIASKVSRFGCDFRMTKGNPSLSTDCRKKTVMAADKLKPQLSKSWVASRLRFSSNRMVRLLAILSSSARTRYTICTHNARKDCR